MALFSPIQIGGLNLANRIIIPPMCQYSAQNGQANQWHNIHYGNLAFSGAGLLIVEATAIVPEGRISPYDLGLWGEETQIPLSRMVKAIRNYSPMLMAVQLGHAGRKASVGKPWEGDKTLTPAEGGWQPVAPSALPYKPDDPAPRELATSELDDLIEAFIESSQRADKAGFDAIELHCAHGYLLHEFLSPITNKRSDEYGGSLENRMRLPLEVFTGIRALFPLDKPIGVRVSGSDWVEGGWDLESTIIFANELAKLGCAYIHVSGGGLSLEQKLALGPGYQTAMAEKIKAATGLPTIAVGMITQAEQAEHILVSGQADMVAIGRAMLYNPRWPWHAAAELGARVDAPPQYWRSQPRTYKDLFTA